jgi:hypothetical protein
MELIYMNQNIFYIFKIKINIDVNLLFLDNYLMKITFTKY